MIPEADMIIFRVPPEEDGGKMTFVKIDYAEGLPDESGRVFTVGEGGTYNQMQWNHIVVAKACEGGSIDLGWFLISDEEGAPQIVHAMEADDLIATIVDIVDNYEPNLEAMELH